MENKNFDYGPSTAGYGSSSFLDDSLLDRLKKTSIINSTSEFNPFQTFYKSDKNNEEESSPNSSSSFDSFNDKKPSVKLYDSNYGIKNILKLTLRIFSISDYVLETFISFLSPDISQILLLKFKAKQQRLSFHSSLLSGVSLLATDEDDLANPSDVETMRKIHNQALKQKKEAIEKANAAVIAAAVEQGTSFQEIESELASVESSSFFDLQALRLVDLMVNDPAVLKKELEELKRDVKRARYFVNDRFSTDFLKFKYYTIKLINGKKCTTRNYFSSSSSSSSSSNRNKVTSTSLAMSGDYLSRVLEDRQKIIEMIVFQEKYLDDTIKKIRSYRDNLNGSIENICKDIIHQDQERLKDVYKKEKDNLNTISLFSTLKLDKNNEKIDKNELKKLKKNTIEWKLEEFDKRLGKIVYSLKEIADKYEKYEKEFEEKENSTNFSDIIGINKKINIKNNEKNGRNYKNLIEDDDATDERNEEFTYSNQLSEFKWNFLYQELSPTKKINKNILDDIVENEKSNNYFNDENPYYFNESHTILDSNTSLSSLIIDNNNLDEQGLQLITNSDKNMTEFLQEARQRMSNCYQMSMEALERRSSSRKRLGKILHSSTEPLEIISATSSLSNVNATSPVSNSDTSLSITTNLQSSNSIKKNKLREKLERSFQEIEEKEKYLIHLFQLQKNLTINAVTEYNATMKGPSTLLIDQRKKFLNRLKEKFFKVNASYQQHIQSHLQNST